MRIFVMLIFHAPVLTVTACLGGGCHRGRDVAAAEVASSMAPIAAFQGEGGRVQRLRPERGTVLSIRALGHRTLCQPASTFAATAPATNTKKKGREKR